MFVQSINQTAMMIEEQTQNTAQINMAMESLERTMAHNTQIAQTSSTISQNVQRTAQDILDEANSKKFLGASLALRVLMGGSHIWVQTALGSKMGLGGEVPSHVVKMRHAGVLIWCIYCIISLSPCLILSVCKDCAWNSLFKAWFSKFCGWAWVICMLLITS